MENIPELLRTILQEELKPIKKDIQTLKEGQKRIERKAEEMRLVVGRIDMDPPQNMTSILERIDWKLDNIKLDIDYTSGKLGKQELEIHRLNKLMDWSRD